MGRGERRLEARLTAQTLETVEQCGLFTADVGACAGVHHDLEIEAAALDVGAEQTCLAGLAHRTPHTTNGLGDLTPNVDEGVIRTNRVRGDDDALDQ